MRLSALLLLLVSALVPLGAQALDYRSLSDNTQVFDAGSKQANAQFILLKGTPVELIVTLDRWAKVREAGGGIGWVERSLLSERRQLIVTAVTADVRQSAAADAPVVFTASKDLLLEPVDKPAGSWVKVKHRDGRTGFIELKAVWGS
ncbi:SH3 domain-containing protein [Uliginosibacterium sp. H3]|uniref:SH3 domain-containing protein n=1 Tax=Uliginosibacterium silvisoli TaxID=3114758 RepID=A0ABU6K9B0_9RHOO|nr:SH3 domain-containing protein [Uliginosibacterium sp. H3]